MSQDLTAISITQFELQLWRFSDKGLMGLLKDIAKYKTRDIFKKFNPEYPDHFKIIDDIERKQTCVERELQNRGYVSLNDRDEFMKWQCKEFYKKENF